MASGSRVRPHPQLRFARRASADGIQTCLTTSTPEWRLKIWLLGETKNWIHDAALSNKALQLTSRELFFWWPWHFHSDADRAAQLKGSVSSPNRNLKSQEKKMKRNTLTHCCAFLTLLLSPVCLFAQRGTDGASGGTQAAEKTQVDAKVMGGLITLYALDPLAQRFCFGDGKDGHIFQNYEVRNRCSDIDFNNYNAGSFTVGVEGGRVGRIIDLGNAAELKQRYGYEETVGNGQGYASLRVEDGRVVVLKDRKSQGGQKLREFTLLFQEGASGASAPIKLGSIYLVRLTDRHDRAFQRIIKLMVVAYTPAESVTIRWQVL